MDFEVGASMCVDDTKMFFGLKLVANINNNKLNGKLKINLEFKCIFAIAHFGQFIFDLSNSNAPKAKLCLASFSNLWSGLNWLLKKVFSACSRAQLKLWLHLFRVLWTWFDGKKALRWKAHEHKCYEIDAWSEGKKERESGIQRSSKSILYTYIKCTCSDQNNKIWSRPIYACPRFLGWQAHSIKGQLIQWKYHQHNNNNDKTTLTTNSDGFFFLVSLRLFSLASIFILYSLCATLLSDE